MEAGIDWDCLAREMIFFSDNSPTGYPAWLAHGKLTPEIQRKGTATFIDLESTKNFDIKGGFQTDGEQDMGPFNGPFLLIELSLESS
jgi:hypothetical protein